MNKQSHTDAGERLRDDPPKCDRLTSSRSNERLRTRSSLGYRRPKCEQGAYLGRTSHALASSDRESELDHYSN